MRKFFNLLRQLVSQIFPESSLKSVGSFFFLRYMCPAIVAPNAFDLITGELNDPDVRRALTMIAKVLQNLANEVAKFKEEFMEPLNSFLTNNIGNIKKFYEDISTVASEGGPADAMRPKFTDEDKYKSLSLLVGQITRNFDLLEKAMEQDPRMKDRESESYMRNKKHLATLKEILQKPEM